MKLIIGILVLALTGCATVGRIKTKAISVFAVKDAGKPATLDESRGIATLPLPKGSRLVETKWEAVAWKPATDRTPEIQAQPARTVMEVVLAGDTEWKRDETRIVADTGTVDTTIAKHRIDVADRAKLLWASMAAAVMAGLFLYIKYPTPAMMCGAASVVFFLAWKLADLPSWFWVIGAIVCGASITLWRGYERREKEEKERAEELAKAKAVAVVAPPNPPVVVLPST